MRVRQVSTRKKSGEAATPPGEGQGRAQRRPRASWLGKQILGSRNRGLQRATLGEGGGEAKQQEGHGKLLASTSSVCSVAHSQLLLVKRPQPGSPQEEGKTLGTRVEAELREK